MTPLQRLSELERKFRCLNIRGVVEKIDPNMGSGGCVRVRYGDDQLSDWLPVKPIRSGESCMWWFPDIGEGVTVTDVETGEILPGSFTANLPPPTRDPDVMFMQFGNGDTLEHNRKTGVFNLTTTAEVNVNSKKATVTAPTIISTGTWTHVGAMSISKTLTVTGASTLTGLVTMPGGFTGFGLCAVPITFTMGGKPVANHIHKETGDYTEVMQ